MAKTNKKGNTHQLSDSQKVGLGVGLTAAIAAAAGSYFLYGSKNAAKNRQTVKSWSLKAKADVLEALEHAKEMSKEDYDQLISTVAGAYAGAQNVTKKELGEFTKEMKEHWATIEKTATGKKKAPAKKSAPKKPVAKKAATKKPASKTAAAKQSTKKAAAKKSK